MGGGGVVEVGYVNWRIEITTCKTVKQMIGSRMVLLFLHCERDNKNGS